LRMPEKVGISMFCNSVVKSYFDQGKLNIVPGGISTVGS
jgi:hypothetical protein